MKKRNIPVWVVVICILGFIYFCYMIMHNFYIDDFKYEVEEDGTILVSSEKFTISSDIKSLYDDETETFYVEGVLTNNTKRIYHSISIEFAVYDLEGNILGYARSYLEKIGSGESWKFKSAYSEIDATDVVSYKLINVSYY